MAKTKDKPAPEKGFKINTDYKTNNEVQKEMDRLRNKIEGSDDEGLKHYAEKGITNWLDQFDAKHNVVHNANFLHRAIAAYNHFTNQQKNA